MTPTNQFRLAVAVIATTAAVAAFFVAPLTCGVIAVVAGLLLATSFGPAGRLAHELRDLPGTFVELTAWGLPIPPGETRVRIRSVFSLGAGFHLMVDTATGAKRIHLKVAQPSGVTTSSNAVTVQSAKYVQLAGRTLPRDTQQPALIVTRLVLVLLFLVATTVHA